MAEIWFDLTTNEGKAAFYAYCDKFDYDLYVAELKARRKKSRINRKKKNIKKKILNSEEFIRASNNHPQKFDLELFNKLWDEIVGQDPDLCAAT